MTGLTADAVVAADADAVVVVACVAVGSENLGAVVVLVSDGDVVFVGAVVVAVSIDVVVGFGLQQLQPMEGSS